MKQLSPKMRRQRKFLLALPLLAFPFLTMAFWALGGGTPVDNTPATAPGLNTELPGAALKDDNSLDKLGYYDRAAADSLQLLEQMKNDPYFKKEPAAADSVLDALAGTIASGTDLSYTGTGPYTDPNEAKVYAKLGELNAAMTAAAGKSRPAQLYDRNSLPDYSSPAADIEQLEQRMASGVHTAPGNTADPEMRQLNGMLEKILDIQHPERLKTALGKDTSSGLRVTREPRAASFSSFDGGGGQGTAGFYGLPDTAVEPDANAIEAVVHASQTLVSGAVVKMRLLEDITVEGHRIGRNQFLYGIASLNRERLEISVTHIRNGSSLFPVKLEVFDMDGLPGLYIPGAIGREVAKQSGDNALQSVTLGTVDPSPGAQAAAAGIETAKNLLSRKIKLIRVQVKAGYKILLRNKTN